MSKDLKSQPKKGLYFPLRFGDAVRLVKDLNLMQYDDSRIVICMKNIDYECDYGIPLLDLIPKREVTLYSSPDKLDSTLTKRASTLALKKLSKFPIKSYTYYAAYLTLSKQLIITQIDVSSKQKKYRSADKLSNAGVLISKIKETKVDEILL